MYDLLAHYYKTNCLEGVIAIYAIGVLSANQTTCAMKITRFKFCRSCEDVPFGRTIGPPGDFWNHFLLPVHET